jgi:hypothetical protein
MSQDKKPKYKVGQVVRINASYYRTPSKTGEQFQKITAVWKWLEYKPQPWGYTFANGDKCNQLHIKPLSKSERG